jgi:mutual gliding-motility protein MglA
MVQINFAQKQVNAKIVYYGPGMSGKTTNLEVIHQRAPDGNRGDLTSISTDGDRTLFFDFMPLDLGTVAGMRTCFQIYTVPGQVYYNSTRKLVLQGVDGVIFVADSSPDMVDENIESMRNLEANLEEYGRSIDDLPMVIQYNKRDMPGALPIDQLEEQLNPRGVPAFEGIANTGQGVFPTLKAVAACVLDSLHKHQSSGASAPAPEASAQPAPSPDTGAIPGEEAPSIIAAEDGGGLEPSPELVSEAEPPAPAPPPQPRERTTISMSQTGFHKAPSTPLPKSIPRSVEEVPAPMEAAAALPEAAPPAPEAPPGNGGLQMSPPPEPAAPVGGAPPGSGLQMARPPGQQQAPANQAPAPGELAQSHPNPSAQAQAQTAAPAVQTAPEAPVQPQNSAASMMRAESSSSVPQRRMPATAAFPTGKSTPSNAPRPTPKGAESKKSSVFTAVIIIVSVAVGAALGSFVLSIL